MSLTFDVLREAIEARIPTYCNKHGENVHCETWSPDTFFIALMGELGEYANWSNRYERGELTWDQFVEEATKELADVAISLDLLANSLDIDLGEAVKNKFNATSEKINSPIRICDDGVYIIKG